MRSQAPPARAEAVLDAQALRPRLLRPGTELFAAVHESADGPYALREVRPALKWSAYRGRPEVIFKTAFLTRGNWRLVETFSSRKAAFDPNQ